jgi:hypothetical protein
MSPPDADGHRRAFYEPVHGSAPDIAGQGKANPLAAIRSLAWRSELSFGRRRDASLSRRSSLRLRQEHARSRRAGKETVSTSGMGDAVLAALDRLAPKADFGEVERTSFSAHFADAPSLCSITGFGLRHNLDSRIRGKAD